MFYPKSIKIKVDIYTFHQRVKASRPGRGLVNFYLNKWEIAERVCYENKKVKSQDDLTILPMVRHGVANQQQQQKTRTVNSYLLLR